MLLYFNYTVFFPSSLSFEVTINISRQLPDKASVFLKAVNKLLETKGEVIANGYAMIPVLFDTTALEAEHDVATGCNRTPDRHSRENRPLKKGIQTGGK